jgi:hypothetical protein
MRLHPSLRILAATLAIGLAACLGPPPGDIFDAADETAGGDDAAGDNAAISDGGRDGTVSQESGGFQDARSDSAHLDVADAGPPPDANPDAQVDSGPMSDAPSCNAGGACSPAPCQLGTTTCDGGTLQCTPTTTLMNGAVCDAGAVCNAGACGACSSGMDCTEAGSCQKMAIACNTGNAVCAAAGTVTDGTPCGTNLYCNGGMCAACTNGANCVPSGKPCNKGVVSCSQGQVVCADQGTPAANGTSCGPNQVCNGGQCGPCSANVQCAPMNACHTGLTSCASGSQVCVDTGNPQTNGIACTGSNLCNQTYTCTAGNCTGSNPVTCTAMDQCHVVGTCDTTTGSCSNPLATPGTSCGTNKVCDASGNCGCAGGYANCSGACINVSGTDASNCGACGRSCLHGACAAGQCQPWLIAQLSGSPLDVTTDGSNVVWLDSSQAVEQASAAGGSTPTTPGPVTTLATVGSTYGVRRIAMANGVVAWLSGDPGGGQIDLWTATESAANSGVIITSMGSSSGAYGTLALAVNPTGGAAYIQLVDELGGPLTGIESCGLGLGSSCSQPITNSSSDLGDDVVVNGTYLFYTTHTAGIVNRYAFPGTTMMASGQAAPFLLALDSSYVYWANLGTGSFSVSRALQATPGPAAVLQNTSGTVNRIASDGKYLYFAGISGTTKVGYVGVGAAGTGTVTPLWMGTSSGQATWVAASGGAVYWSDSGDHTIRGVRAPP